MNNNTILVVDDTLESLKLLSDILEAEGYNVMPANSGEIALASIEFNLPCLILLDILMPVMDGFEVLHRLKADEKTRHIPVIILSAISESEQRIKGLELGAVDFISKPFQRQELLAKVKTHYELRHTRLLLEEANVHLQTEIAERKRIEHELEKYSLHLEELVEERTADLCHAKNAAEAANQAKSVFIANMNHELRTPLNAIVGFSELMARDTTISPQNREKLELINHNGWYLLRIIESVFDISRIDAGRLELNVEVFDLFKLLTLIGETIKTYAETKHLHFDLDITPNVPQYIKSDSVKLEKILINLLENALKFTAHGQIKLSVAARSFPTAAKKTLEIEVIDSGIGILESNLDELFKPFVQLARTDAGLEGTGLGLATTKSLVELMGGKISVKSVFGEGSTFKIELPVTLAHVDEITTEISSHVINLLSNPPATELTAEMLAVLSPELKQQLHHAALILNIDDVVVQIQQVAPKLAICLQKLAQNCQFDEIIRLTSETHPHFGTAANNFCV